MAYNLREIRSSFPLSLMERTYSTWIYGKDPVSFLKADEDLDKLWNQYQNDLNIFSTYIRERIISNPHRYLLTFAPDCELQEKRDSGFIKKMKELKESCSEERLTNISKMELELEERQNTPDLPEVVALLPRLELTQLPQVPKHIEIDSEWVE